MVAIEINFIKSFICELKDPKSWDLEEDEGWKVDSKDGLGLEKFMIEINLNMVNQYFT